MLQVACCSPPERLWQQGPAEKGQEWFLFANFAMVKMDSKKESTLNPFGEGGFWAMPICRLQAFVLPEGGICIIGWGPACGPGRGPPGSGGPGTGRRPPGSADTACGSRRTAGTSSAAGPLGVSRSCTCSHACRALSMHLLKMQKKNQHVDLPHEFSFA